MEKDNFLVKRLGILTGVVACFVVLIVVNASMDVKPIYESEEIWQEVYRWTPHGAEANPGAGASGFLEIYFMNLSTWTAGGYGVNVTATLEGWCDANMPSASPNAWASADSFDIEDFESSKTFVIGVRARWNATHAKDGADWFGNDTEVQITVTCTGWDVGGNINNVTGTMIESSNNSAYDFLYTNTWWTNGGVGYQISDDAVMTISEVYLEARF